MRAPALAPLSLRGKPVVTAIACRNMWLMAQEKLNELLAAVGARLIDNVVRIDPGPTLATLITTLVWMFSGRKKGFLGLPDAGLDEAQIQGVQNCCPHGKQKYLCRNNARCHRASRRIPTRKTAMPCNTRVPRLFGTL